MLKYLAVLPAALAGQAAWAEATVGGAADLTATFQTYLGTTPGVVTVTPEGEAYRVRLDAAPLLAAIPAEAQATIAVSPMEMMLTDNGDGTWAVTQDQPLSFTMKVGTELDMTLSAADLSCEGTYDTAIKAFATQSCTMTDMVMDQTQMDPAMGEVKTNYTVASVDYELTSKAGANGGVDSTTAYTLNGLDQTITMPMGEGMPAMPIRITTGTYSMNGTGTGFRNDAILSLVSWFVAHPDAALIEAGKGEIKGLVANGLPLFEHLQADGLITEVNVETPIGPVAIAEVGLDVELRGAVSDGLFREAISFNGLTLPPGVLPPFAEGLVPQSFSIDFAVDKFDAAAAAQVLLGLLDLPTGAEPPEGLDMTLLSALMPEGTVGITLAPGEVSNATYTLTYEGSMTAGPAAMPVGAGKITAKGYDAAMALMDGAPDDMKSQILPVMGMARGLAKDQGDGTLVWEIDATQPGTFKINGMDLMGMQ